MSDIGHWEQDHGDCECFEELDHDLHDCDCPGYPLASERAGSGHTPPHAGLAIPDPPAEGTATIPKRQETP